MEFDLKFKLRLPAKILNNYLSSKSFLFVDNSLIIIKFINNFIQIVTVFENSIAIIVQTRLAE